MKNSLKSTKKAFTLIEVLVVIGIIAILAAVVLIAINPARQFKQAHDSQRSSNINAILNAIGQRLADNKGVWTTTTSCAALPSSTSTIAYSGSNTVNLYGCIVPTYMSALPYDPTWGSFTSQTDYQTAYSIVQDSVSGRISITASSETNPGTFITVTR